MDHTSDTVSQPQIKCFLKWKVLIVSCDAKSRDVWSAYKQDPTDTLALLAVQHFVGLLFTDLHFIERGMAENFWLSGWYWSLPLTRANGWWPGCFCSAATADSSLVIL